MDTKLKKEQRERRKKCIRAKIAGSFDKPRISVFKSNRYISAQLIDDSKRVTIASASSKNMKGKKMLDKARMVGKSLAEQAKVKNIKEAVFDRGGYIYTGSVRALSDGAREGGLKF